MTHDDDAEVTRRLVDDITERQALAARTDLLDREDAQAYLGLGITRFNSLVAAGSIPVAHRHRGLGHRFAPEDLDRWLEEQGVTPERPAEPRIISLTAQDSPPLAAGPGTSSVKEVSTVPSPESPTLRSPMLDRMLDRRKAAAYCGVGLTTFDALVRSEKIPHLRIGRRHLFDPSDLDMALLVAKYNGGGAR